MMAVSRRNSALKFYVNGRSAKDLHGLTDITGKVLSAYDTAVSRSVIGLKRRAAPAASRAIRENYGVAARELTGKLRIESGRKGRRADRSDYISIWASTRRISLLAFGGRWSGRRSKGATASIMAGAKKLYSGSFIATVRGLRAIRVRSRDASGKRNPRGPLIMLRGPSPFEMLSGVDYEPSRASRDAVLSELTTFYRAELRRQFKLNGVASG